MNYDATDLSFFLPTFPRLSETRYTIPCTRPYTSTETGIITADDWMTNDETGAQLPGDSYRYMKQLLGIGRVDGQGPADVSLTAANTNHPAIEGYEANELILHYDENWYSYYDGVPGQPVTALVNQTVTGSAPGTYSAMLASETGGRHVALC